MRQAIDIEVICFLPGDLLIKSAESGEGERICQAATGQVIERALELCKFLLPSLVCMPPC